MQKIVDQITDQLVGLITSDKPSYNPKELLKAGIPSFVVERVRLYLEDKVKEDIGSVNSPWFDGEARLVADAWKDYVRSAVSSSQIPKESLYSVLNAVVKDIIYVFIEPRKNMAEYIFRDDEVLGYDELQTRCARLTIYKHFGTAIPLYMEKRDLDELTRERCQQLIQKLDAKLVASYTAQDWAQKLEQLFILFGGKVDPMLLTTFFDDKGLTNLSDKFKGHHRPLTKTDFIYIISNEEVEGLKKKESTKTAPPKDEEGTARGSKKDEDQEQNLMENFFGNYDYVPGENGAENSLINQYSENGLTDDEMSELLSDIAKDGVVEVDDFDHVESLNELFSLRTEEDEEEQVSETSEEIAERIKKSKEKNPEEVKEFRENLISILDKAKHSFEGIASDDNEPEGIEVKDDSLADIFIEETESQEKEPLSKKEKAEKQPDEEPPEEDEEKPMWAQFLSADQMDVLMGGERNAGTTDDPETDDPGEKEVAVKKVQKKRNIHKLDDLLAGRKQEFIKVIFSGSERKYKNAVAKIKTFENWKQTSAYIQKNIFKKNDVDMLDGATVDFTDRLHTYFNELKST